MFDFIFGNEKLKKQRRQQENVFDRFHRGKFHPESEYDSEYYKKNMYGNEYDPDYDKKRELRLKKKYGKKYIPNYDQKLWSWDGKEQF